MSDGGDLAIENVLRPNYDKIYQLLINPLDVARQLYAEGVLGENVLDELSPESKSLSSQKDCFFKHLRGVIRGGGHGKLKSFGRVLLKYKNTVDVAERLLEEYDKEFPGSQTLPVQATSVNSQEVDEYHVIQDYDRVFDAKYADLGTLFYKITGIIEKSNISLNDLKRILIFSYPEYKSEIKTKESVEDVLYVVRRYTSLDNPSHLEAIAKHFDLHEATRLIKEYDDSIDKFCKDIPVKHAYGKEFMKDFQGNCLKSETVKFVLDWKPDEKRLADIKRLLKKAFHEMASNVKVMVVYEGNSIIVVCYAPPHLSGVLTRLVEENEIDLLKEDVISVSICGFMVMKRNLKTEQYIRDLENQVLKYEPMETETGPEKQKSKTPPIQSETEDKPYTQRLVDEVSPIQSETEDTQCLLDEVSKLKDQLLVKHKMNLIMMQELSKPELLATNSELGRQLLFAKTNVITLEEQIEKLKLETTEVKAKLTKQMKQMEEQIEKYKSDAEKAKEMLREQEEICKQRDQQKELADSEIVKLQAEVKTMRDLKEHHEKEAKQKEELVTVNENLTDDIARMRRVTDNTTDTTYVKRSFIMSDIQPNLQQLVKELQSISTKWKLFGVFLGIPNDDLEEIDEDKRNVDDKLDALCYKWLQMKPRGNWKDIMKALKKIKRLDLADKLEEKYIKYLPSSDTSYGRLDTMSTAPYQSPVMSFPGPTDDNTETTHVDVPKKLMKNIDDLAIQFMSLLTDIQLALKQKLINNELDLEHLRRFISFTLHVPHQPLSVTEGRDEIDTLFSPFYDHLCFLDTDLFHWIDKNYLNCELEMKIERYDDEIDRFMKSTTIIDFKEMIRSKGLDKGIPVILRLSQRCGRRTLYYLRHLTDYLFEDSSSLLKFDVIHH